MCVCSRVCVCVCVCVCIIYIDRERETCRRKVSGALKRRLAGTTSSCERPARV